ncbi:hypothetical protein O9929_01210 [Vibrio lentus]|nr:hypothetical protein [Vibrio lentus]
MTTLATAVEDPGSIGPSRKYEKNAIEYFRKLAAQLKVVPDQNSYDSQCRTPFKPNRRVVIARENEAHLLISYSRGCVYDSSTTRWLVFVLEY